MDGTAVKQIAEMQREIDGLESDLITLLILVKMPESAQFFSYWNQEALTIAEEIVKLHQK